MTNLIRAAEISDAADLSRIGATTFHLACNAGATKEDISSYINDELTTARFEEHIACPEKSIFVALADSRICGYLMLCREEEPTDIVAQSPIELRRLYVLPEQHGSGVAADLMRFAIHEAIAGGHDILWLGVSDSNERGKAFYRKHGFGMAGVCRFPLGNTVHEGLLMSHRVSVDNSPEVETRCDALHHA